MNSDYHIENVKYEDWRRKQMRDPRFLFWYIVLWPRFFVEEIWIKICIHMGWYAYAEMEKLP